MKIVLSLREIDDLETTRGGRCSRCPDPWERIAFGRADTAELVSGRHGVRRKTSYEKSSKKVNGKR